MNTIKNKSGKLTHSGKLENKIIKSKMEPRVWKTSSSKNFKTVRKNVEEDSGKEKTTHAHLSAKFIA